MPRKVLISAVLKPVDDVRLFDKIAQSIYTSFPGHQVYVVAHRAKSVPRQLPDRLQLIPLFRFRRLHPQRILANVMLLRKLLRIRPEWLVVATFELLPAALLYKLFFGGVLVYDVQENYYRNISYTRVFPPVLRNVLAVLVRGLEWCAHPCIDRYWLAEACYAEEMPRMKKKGLLLRNTFLRASQPKGKKTTIPFRFLYTGTISEDYGIFQALDFVVFLHKRFPQVTLHIMGFSAQKRVLKKLKQRIMDKEFIQLEGGEQPVPHARILEAMQEAAFLVMPYTINKSVARRIPTKMYEALALQGPMLIQANPYWEGFLAQYPFQAAYWLDFTRPDTWGQFAEEIPGLQFYADSGTPKDIYWEEEAVRMLDYLRTLP